MPAIIPFSQPTFTCLIFVVLLQKYIDSDVADEKDSLSSTSLMSGVPVFQNLLMKYLDTQAPILGMYEVYFAFPIDDF